MTFLVNDTFLGRDIVESMLLSAGAYKGTKWAVSVKIGEAAVIVAADTMDEAHKRFNAAFKRGSAGAVIQRSD